MALPRQSVKPPSVCERRKAEARGQYSLPRCEYPLHYRQPCVALGRNILGAKLWAVVTQEGTLSGGLVPKL
jgi:hypothetical protein